MQDEDTFWSQLYQKGHDYRPITGLEVDQYLSSIKNGKARALDIGCGTGQLIRELYHKGFVVTGIDVSATAIKIAKSRTVHDIEYFHLDIESDHIDSISRKTYHLITCRLVFAFIRNKDKFLQRVQNLLTNDGVFIIVTLLLDKVLPEKRKTAVDIKMTEKLLNKYFSVEISYMDNLGFIVCRNK